MIHTITAAGIIEPGLYQINGTGVDDLVKIGEITATELPGQNTLLLSCELADLEANPVFQSWYDPADPRLDVAGFTQRITVLGGVAGGRPHAGRRLAPARGGAGSGRQPAAPAGRPGAARARHGRRRQRRLQRCRRPLPRDRRAGLRRRRGLSRCGRRPWTTARRSSTAATPTCRPWSRETGRRWWRASATTSATWSSWRSRPWVSSDVRPALQLRAAPNPFASRTELAFELRGDPAGEPGHLRRRGTAGRHAGGRRVGGWRPRLRLGRAR